MRDKIKDLKQYDFFYCPWAPYVLCFYLGNDEYAFRTYPTGELEQQSFLPYQKNMDTVICNEDVMTSWEVFMDKKIEQERMN